MTDPRPAPYPADTRAKGWRFEIDTERIEQSDTWPLAAEIPMCQHALLMMWMIAWTQSPCGSFPNDEAVIRAKCRIPPAMWAKCRDVLLRGWWLADDGRLYHDTLVTRVEEMMGRRRSDSDRQAAKRRREALEAAATHTGITGVSHVTPTVVTPESSTDNRIPTSSFPTVKKKARAAAPPSVAVSVLIDAGLDEQTATEFIAHKAGLKAPLTARAWADHLREAGKAGWTALLAAEKVMAKGWKGFEAKYVAGESIPTRPVLAAVTVPSNAADATAALLRADEEHRREMIRQRDERRAREQGQAA